MFLFSPIVPCGYNLKRFSFRIINFNSRFKIDKKKKKDNTKDHRDQTLRREHKNGEHRR